MVIIDAKGEAHSFPTDASGNFAATEKLATPYRAMVVQGTKIREMQTPQKSGDCNACHAAEPTHDAPGRIMAPE